MNSFFRKISPAGNFCGENPGLGHNSKWTLAAGYGKLNQDDISRRTIRADSFPCAGRRSHFGAFPRTAVENVLKKLLDKTFWKFILVGVANTVFGAALMFGFYNLLHCSYWVSSAANYVGGSILSFFLNKRFTFRNTEKGWKPAARFVLIIALCYGIAYGAARPLVRQILKNASPTLQENGAMLVGMGLFTCLNYLGQRFFAFRTPDAEQDP